MMGILQRRSKGHWPYFIALEKDVVTLSRYVDFSSPNMLTFSLEMARILLAAGAEADVLLKRICELNEPDSKVCRIGDYFEIISRHHGSLFTFEVQLPRWGISLVPWEQWQQTAPPDWWTSYNKVKHHRASHFHRANLQCTIEAVAAVFVLNVYAAPEAAREGTLKPIPSIFRPGPGNYLSRTHDDFEFGIKYRV